MSRDQWWIDYIEGELDPATEFEMRRVLRTSAKDLELVSAIKALKKLISHHDEVLEPNPLDLKIMHNNIMEQIMSKDVDTSYAEENAKRKSVRISHLQLVR